MRRLTLSLDVFCLRYFHGNQHPPGVCWSFYQDYLGSGMTFENYKKSTTKETATKPLETIK